jgi:hypothetical protein
VPPGQLKNKIHGLHGRGGTVSAVFFLAVNRHGVDERRRWVFLAHSIALKYLGLGVLRGWALRAWVLFLRELAEGFEGVLVGLGLGVPEAGVGAIGFGEEFLVGAFFDDASVGEDDDLVGSSHRGEAVGDH